MTPSQCCNCCGRNSAASQGKLGSEYGTRRTCLPMRSATHEDHRLDLRRLGSAMYLPPCACFGCQALSAFPSVARQGLQAHPENSQSPREPDLSVEVCTSKIIPRSPNMKPQIAASLVLLYHYFAPMPPSVSPLALPTGN